ncbi:MULTISPECIES: hypothetical protein [Streptomyces]|uniref:Secreted protein n=1 Tax=Streptomyces tsukubensis (strain DSM 42081 / NBRC 108919 / NRRL 18488 / 9993) TaxID=1114943 RepID=A0A7G3UJT5_STRT9|nr:MULTISPECIES: hypothetical protein [Streptomyces]MYS68149.1 hypothetical protein [Streptomyces sp. SID5473]QKM69440.1 hypothetical protein STSU_021950 [Streptomyces tsukubensis NRRL18488]TAI42630.1 hypothetical protein EWI31_19580 [Streptomyces tsukubensis]
MSRLLSAARTKRGGRTAALLAVPLCVTTLISAAPASASGSPGGGRAAVVAEPTCTTPTTFAVTGGTIGTCRVTRDGEEFQRLTFTNTNRAQRDISVVIYDCDSGTADDWNACVAGMKATYNLVWRQIKSKQTVSADLQLANANSLVFWTTDPADKAASMSLLGSPWNS